MFTGIIETKAQVIKKTESQLILKRPAIFDDIKLGSSICVSGTCLSIVVFDDVSMTFDVIQETWDRTMLGSLNVGDMVNLERALLADGRFEGHIVQGHVDGVGVVVDVSFSDKKNSEIRIKYPKELHGLIVEKGSIAIDGVSLTVASVNEESFSVALIPHTLEYTTIGILRSGDRVNLEADILGKYVRGSVV